MQRSFCRTGAGASTGSGASTGAHLSNICIIQAEPTTAVTAPLGASHNLDLIQIHLYTVGQAANDAGAGSTRLIADIDIGAAGNGSLGNHGFGGTAAALIVGSSAIVGVLQGNPAAAVMAPQFAANALGFHNHNLIALIQLTGNNSTVQASVVADIDIGIGNLDLNTPLGIQGLAGLGRTQIGNQSTAGLVRIPTAKSSTGLGRHSLDCHGSGGIEALHLVLTCAAAIGIQDDICIVRGRILGILTIQVQIGLSQTALDQACTGSAANIGPQADGIQEVIAGGLVQNSRTELAGTGKPAVAAVIRERNQGIKLSLR